MTGRRTGVKCIIQIPCYNEEASLPITLSALPRSVPGVDKVEWLVIDDGSTDRTSQVAKEHGVDHVIRLPYHQGLAAAFTACLQESLSWQADVIVSTDADNQYRAADIPQLVAPILSHGADIVVGARSISDTAHFPWSKKVLQKLGSFVVRTASGTSVADAASGFRAYSRRAAMRLRVFGRYTYTLETLIQAGRYGMRVISVPVRTNPDLRPSRLVRGVWSYVFLSALTILRTVMVYYPLRFFSGLGALGIAAGILVGLRFIYFFIAGAGTGHVQSLILSSILIVVGTLLVVVGILADLIAVNRRILEDLDWELKAMRNTTGTTTD